MNNTRTEEVAREAFERLTHRSKLLFRRGGSALNEDVPQEEYVDTRVQHDWEHWLVAWQACAVALAQQVPELQLAALPAYPEDAEDLVTIPRGLIGAACSAIDHKRDAPKLLEKLRRYTVGDLSRQPAQQVPDLQAAQRLAADLPKVGEPETQFFTGSTADLRAVLTALAQQPPTPATCWSEGFAAGEGWRRSVDEFWQTNDYGASPAEPANPYKYKAGAQVAQQVPELQPVNARLVSLLKDWLEGFEESLEGGDNEIVEFTKEAIAAAEAAQGNKSSSAVLTKEHES